MYCDFLVDCLLFTHRPFAEHNLDNAVKCATNAVPPTKPHRGITACCADLLCQDHTIITSTAQRNRIATALPHFLLTYSAYVRKHSVAHHKPCQWCAGRFLNQAHTKKQIFMQSLICKVAPTAKLLYCFEAMPPNAVAKHGSGLSHSHLAANQADFGPSPYPQLDQFITCVCNQVNNFPLMQLDTKLSHCGA